MATVREVLDEVSARVHSFTAVREQLTSLTTTVSTTDTTFTVANSERITYGLIEVDEELMYVDTVDGATVHLFPFGRGYESTTAAVHNPDTKVLNDPLYPRKSILRAVQVAAQMCAPELFTPKWITLPYSAGPLGEYTLPSDASAVRQVYIEIPGRPSIAAGAWSVVSANPPLLHCFHGWNGYPLSVLYGAPIGVPTSPDDDLDDLGLTNVRDVIVWAACWQLLQSMEPGRLSMSSVSQMVNADSVPVTSATKVAQQFYAGFAQRKQDVLRTLNRQYPIQLHRKARP